MCASFVKSGMLYSDSDSQSLVAIWPKQIQTNHQLDSLQQQQSPVKKWFTATITTFEFSHRLQALLQTPHPRGSNHPLPIPPTPALKHPCCAAQLTIKTDPTHFNPTRRLFCLGLVSQFLGAGVCQSSTKPLVLAIHMRGLCWSLSHWSCPHWSITGPHPTCC